MGGSFLNVTNLNPSMQRSHLNFDLLVTEESHKNWDDSGVNDHLDLFVAPICQVGQSPNCVYEDLSRQMHNAGENTFNNGS